MIRKQLLDGRKIIEVESDLLKNSEQFIEIKDSIQFHEIQGNQNAIELSTRAEVKEVVDKFKAVNKPYTIFSLQHEEGWYITYGIRYVNNIGYYVLEGNFTLPNDIDF